MTASHPSKGIIMNLVRAALSAFSPKGHHFIKQGRENQPATQIESSMIQEARLVVDAAEFGELTALELANRLHGGTHPEDADGCLSDVQAIVRGEKGPDALNAFAEKLYRLMTEESKEPDGGKPRAFSIAAVLSHVPPSTLVDSEIETEAEGCAKWAHMVGAYLDDRDEFPKDVIGTIAEMRAILLDKFGAEGRKGFVDTLRAKMISEPAKADAYEGIPQQHHRAVQARLMVAVMEGRTVSPQEAYRGLLEEWKRFAKSGAAIEQAATEEAVKFLKRAGITAEDHAWGAFFTGSKAALIKAGLVSAKLIPTNGKEKKYILPLNHLDGYMAACYGPTRGKIPASWDAKIAPTLGYGNSGKYSVWVQFNMDERNVRERAAPAIVELDSPAPNLDLLRELVRAIPPRPLSVVIPEAIKRAKHYPKSEE